MTELTVGSVFAGHRLEGIAGRGGMGVVYRATDLTLERTVALKVIAPELTEDHRFARRFVRESKMAAAIRDPHVLPVYRAGEEDGHLFVTMDYVEGRDLRDWIDSEGRLEPPAAADIVAQVAQALDAAHAKGLVHRDVKPANVLIEEGSAGPHAYLTDFGLTKPEASAETALTETGAVIGTLDYMAPEQLSGQPIDARSDVYALGCVLFEALTGRVPYPAESAVQKMYAHGNLPPPSLTEAALGMPADLDDVVQRAMAKDPAERFLSAGDLGRAANAAVEGDAAALTEQAVATGGAGFSEQTTELGGPAAETTEQLPSAPSTEPQPPPQVAPERDSRRTGRRPVVVAGLVVAALALAAVVGFVVLGGEDELPEAAPIGGSFEETTEASSTPPSSSDEDEIRAVWEQFIEDARASDGAATCGSLDQETVDLLGGEEACATGFDAVGAEAIVEIEGSTEIGTVTVEGDTATAFGGGEEATFVNEGGAWKLSFAAELGDLSGGSG